MSDIDYGKYPLVTFRVSGELSGKLSERGENLNSVAKRDLQRYYDALAAHLPVFSIEEALLLCDALNGVIARPGSLYVNIAASDAITSAKWDVDKAPLLARLDALSPIECQAVIDAVEWAWNGSEYHVDLRRRVVAVGLAK